MDILKISIIRLKVKFDDQDHAMVGAWQVVETLRSIAVGVSRPCGGRAGRLGTPYFNFVKICARLRCKSLKYHF